MARVAMIPKKIHYCWFGKHEMSDLNKRCLDSWYKTCPEFEIICWDENNYEYQKNSFMKEAYEKAIACAKNYGLFVGISSGAALAAINHLSNKYKNIVVILPDGGERYLSVWDLEK